MNTLPPPNNRGTIRIVRVEKNSRTEAMATPGKRVRGQAIPIVALLSVVLVLFVGLGVDVGNLMGKRAKLQSAVDSSALSAAEMLIQTNSNQIATDKAFQMLETNGVLTGTLNMSQTVVTFPGPQQVRVRAVQRADTFFMRIIPIWRTVEIGADATADINSYAEINAKPYGKAGVVNELNMSVWGVNSWRGGGDAYSPRFIDNTNLNPQYDMTPYGYLYRVDVPPSYAYSHVVVQVFDPDSYNRGDYPPAPPTPCKSPCIPTPTPTWSPDNYAYCPSRVSGTCETDTSGGRQDPGLKINAYPINRPAFWRVDEYRTPHDVGGGIASVYNPAYVTRATYTLWHFNPHISSAFDDPASLSDQNGTYVAQYDNNAHQDSFTDLRWYQPNGFDIQLTGCGGGDCFEREENGGFYFYLYIRGIGGSSENNFDLRSGPPSVDIGTNTLCTDAALGAAYTTDCYVNKLYYDNSLSGRADWDPKGTSIFAKRALPLNLDTGNNFPMLFVQVPRTAAGQTLGVRHFDQDCYPGGTCGRDLAHTLTYEMQKCGADPTLDASFVTVATGYVGPSDLWVPNNTYDDPEKIIIPSENTPAFIQFFGDGTTCTATTSWMRLKRDPSGSNDTTVWEMPFIRPRLIR